MCALLSACALVGVAAALAAVRASEVDVIPLPLTLAEVEWFLVENGWEHDPDARSVWFAGSRTFVRGDDRVGLPAHDGFVDTAQRLDEAVQEALRCDRINGRDVRAAYVRAALEAAK